MSYSKCINRKAKRLIQYHTPNPPWIGHGQILHVPHVHRGIARHLAPQRLALDPRLACHHEIAVEANRLGMDACVGAAGDIEVGLVNLEAARTFFDGEDGLYRSHRAGRCRVGQDRGSVHHGAVEKGFAIGVEISVGNSETEAGGSSGGTAGCCRGCR